NKQKVRKLQGLLNRSWSAKMIAVRQVTQQNQGKKTAGVDGVTALPDRVIPIPEEIASTGLTTLSHPYFWSAFTVIGNWN
ncbi:MAG: reverse transcriptase N-terminal domain-containing protein, partial [Hormoscilla sp. SP12CHS1]|nr:reverse transcriptase N-terminal domain-containing protein [Hormoscilla sp. SP12CHS1]